MKYDLDFLENFVDQCYKLINYKKNILRMEKSNKFKKEDSEKYYYYNMQKKEISNGIKVIKYIFEEKLFQDRYEELKGLLDILEDRVVPIYFQ